MPLLHLITLPHASDCRVRLSSLSSMPLADLMSCTQIRGIARWQVLGFILWLCTGND
jgi:hypothetical protein